MGEVAVHGGGIALWGRPVAVRGEVVARNGGSGLWRR